MLYFNIETFLVMLLLDCDPGRYGYRCNDTCGHCRDQNKCFHTNGSCLTGCDTGYYGDLCKTGIIGDVSINDLSSWDKAAIMIATKSFLKI